MTTMTATPISRPITADELYAMEDSVGYELVDGQLRERNVSKESSRIGMEIGRQLGNEAKRTGEAEVYGSDLGYQCFPPESTKDIRKPDASVVRKERLAALPADFGYMPIPADLVVEVVSPNDLAYELNEKVEEYLSAGFPLVWVVDPPRKTITIHRGDGSVTKRHENDEISGESALPGFRCRVAELLV
jgi:Uma2 family endonuclease